MQIKKVCKKTVLGTMTAKDVYNPEKYQLMNVKFMT